MALPVYSTGTATVDHLGTVVTGAGGLWSGINAKQGDYFVRDDGVAVITEVTDPSTLQITPWPGASVAGGTYAIEQNYVGRVVGVAAAEDVGEMLEKLHTDGLPFLVGSDETVPDPSYGDEGQLAFQPSTGLWWVKSGGAWVPSSGLVALGYGGVSATSLLIGLGTKAFVTQPNLAYNGARVRAASAANQNNFMIGQASYSGTTLTMTADTIGGAGVHADWLFSIAGDTGAPGAVGPVGPAGGAMPDAPSNGSTYGRKNAAWVAINSGAIVADTAPTGAPDNALWWESDTGMLYVHYNDGTSTQWVAVGVGTGSSGGGGGGSGAQVYMQDTPPAGALAGSLWWNSTNGQLYLYYNDGDSTQWVITAPYSDPSAYIAKSGDTVTGVIAFAQSPTAPTPPAGDNSANVATTAFVNSISGAVVNSVYAELTAVFNVTVAMPVGSTPPTNTQGSEILTATITPRNTTNKLRVRFQGYAAPAAADNMCGAIFLNAETTARAAQYTASPAGFQQPIMLECQFSPGSTSPQTVRVRAGSAGGNMTFNANMGGARRATLVIEEIGA